MIIGVGLNKTGTKTLAACLRTLGYRHLSWGPKSVRLVKAYTEGRIDELMDVASRYDSCEDLPWPWLYRAIDARFADARFILTVRRSSAVWLESMINHCRGGVGCISIPIKYGGRRPEHAPTRYVEEYERHNAEVNEYFAGRTNFVRLCWEDGAGWPELCKFLELASPDIPFPHENRTKPPAESG
jgi:hypothetical protein